MQRNPKIALAIIIIITAAARLNLKPTEANAAEQQSALPVYDASDRDALAVNRANVFESDRFWPFRITLNQDWMPPDSDEIIPARPGVLVRVNRDRTLRVDFATHGQHDIPIDQTNLVEAANRIRTGRDSKLAPNLILSIGNKLIDTTGNRIHVYHIPRTANLQALLCLFIDPDAPGIAAIADLLARLEEQTQLEVVVFPITRTVVRDLGVWKRLRAAGIRAPFIRDRYRTPFIHSLLGPPGDVDTPFFQLVTPEGRLLLSGPLKTRTQGQIDAWTAAIEAARPSR